MLNSSFPDEWIEKYSFLIENPKSLDQVSCAKLLFSRIKEKFGEDNGIVRYWGYGPESTMGSNSDYTTMDKIAKGHQQPFVKPDTIVKKWIGHCENEHKLINSEDLKKNLKLESKNKNDNKVKKIDNIISDNGLEFEALWDELVLSQTEGTEYIKLIGYDLKNRLSKMLPRAFFQNQIKKSFGVTPYTSGNVRIEFMNDYDTREIKDGESRKLISELLGIFDKLLNIVNGNIQHFFSGSKEKTELKSRAQTIYNQLIKSNIKLSIKKSMKSFRLNSPPIVKNYVPHKELNIIPGNKAAINQEDELHNPAGSSSYRFMCKIDLVTIIDLRFGNKAHFEPIQLKKYDHVLDEHLTMQLDQLIQNVNNPNNRFNLKTVK